MGYNSQVGPDGRALSPADSASASALPARCMVIRFIIILDEPNSNLDAQGEEALASAIMPMCRARGAIVIAVAHRPSLLASVDLVLLMKEGKAIAFGPKEKLVGHLLPDPRQDRGQSLRGQIKRLLRHKARILGRGNQLRLHGVANSLGICGSAES
jgi:ATP-binding cassette subfamily C protein PrsD